MASPESLAGTVVRYAKDHLQLVIIIVVILIIWYLYSVGFPRLNTFSKVQDIDAFLLENQILTNNAQNVISKKTPLKLWKYIYGSERIFQLTSALNEQISKNYKGSKDPYITAFMEYYVFYGKNVKDDDQADTIMCNGLKTKVRYPKFYRNYYAFLQSMGDIDPSLGTSDKLCKMEMANKDDLIVNRIVQVGDLIKALATEVQAIIDTCSNTNIVAFMIVPNRENVAMIAKDIETYGKDIDKVYSSSFNYTSVNEFSWIMFEALSQKAPQLPPFDQKIKPLLINYMNSNYKKRLLARNVLIRNDELCDFIDRHPIYSRVMLTDIKGDKAILYQLIKSMYADSLNVYADKVPALLDLAKNLADLKSFYTSVSVLNLYLNIYQNQHKRFNRDTIKSIYKSKYMDWVDFFLYLWKPYWEDFILNKILMFFYRIFTKEYWEHVFLKKFYGFWMKIGNSIMSMPSNLAQRIGEKRKENFVGQGEFLVEGFLGKIFGPIIAVGKFFISLLKIVTVIVQLVLRLANDPFGTLIDIFTLIIATLLSILLTIVYAILSLPIVVLIPFTIYFVITEVVKFVVFSIIYLALFALVTLVIVLLTIVNICSGNKLKNLALCQNSPGAWYRTPNYQKGNKFERSILCAKPCPTNYAPDSATGFMCMKIKKGIPNYCPKAEIMRIFTGYNRKDKKYTYPDYQTAMNMKYEGKLPSQRERILLDHYVKGDDFFEQCGAMNKYDTMTRSICAGIDTIAATQPNGMSERDVKRLTRVCNQAYCNSRYGGAYTVCSSLTSFNDDNLSTLIKNICMIIFSVIMFTIVVILIVYAAAAGANGDLMFSSS